LVKARAEQSRMPVAAAHRGLATRRRCAARELGDLGATRSKAGARYFRTERELRAGFRNDLRFAQHEFGDGRMVAAIECGHPLAHRDALSVTCGCMCSPMKLSEYAAISAKSTATAPSALQATMPMCLALAGHA